MTEEEAKLKWCPMARFHVVENSPQTVYSNREHGDLMSFCIASYCMMWRGIPTRDEVENGFYPRDGYCGLGGKP